LSENLNLESADIEQIINILDPDSKKIVSYDFFLNIIKNSQNLEEILKKYYSTIT